MERYTPGTLTAPKGKPANIFLAIAEAKKLVGIVAKDKVVGQGSNSYKGVSDYDAMLKIQKAFAEIGLVFFLSDSEETTELQDYETKYGTKQRIFTRLECRFTLAYGHTGEMITVKGHGHGSDPLDKAVGKALTYAKKTALLALLLAPTGDDTDNHHSEQAETAGKAKIQAPAVTSNAPELKQWQDQPKERGNLDKMVEGIKKGDGTLKAMVDYYNRNYTHTLQTVKVMQARHDILKILHVKNGKLAIMLDASDA